nr:MAG TPA: hypothetical protein [Caudoviricetes sp.]
MFGCSICTRLLREFLFGLSAPVVGVILLDLVAVFPAPCPEIFSPGLRRRFIQWFLCHPRYLQSFFVFLYFLLTTSALLVMMIISQEKRNINRTEMQNRKFKKNES